MKVYEHMSKLSDRATVFSLRKEQKKKTKHRHANIKWTRETFQVAFPRPSMGLQSVSKFSKFHVSLDGPRQKKMSPGVKINLQKCNENVTSVQLMAQMDHPP